MLLHQPRTETNDKYFIACKVISSFAFLPAKKSSSKSTLASRDLISLSAMTKIQRKTNSRILFVHIIESIHIILFLNVTTKHQLWTWLSWTCLKSTNPVSINFHDSSPPSSVNYKDVNLLLKSVDKGNNSRALNCTIVKIGQAIGGPSYYLKHWCASWPYESMTIIHVKQSSIRERWKFTLEPSKNCI